MKHSLLILAFISLTTFIFGQYEEYEVLTVCYMESIDGKDTSLSFEPDTYREKIKFTFESGYQIKIREEKKGEILEILRKYHSFHNKSVSIKNTSLQLMGEFTPETISKGKKIIVRDKLIKIYYSKKFNETENGTGNLMIKIPELIDMFGSGTAPEHSIFIPENCLKDLISYLEK